MLKNEGVNFYGSPYKENPNFRVRFHMGGRGSVVGNVKDTMAKVGRKFFILGA